MGYSGPEKMTKSKKGWITLSFSYGIKPEVNQIIVDHYLILIKGT